MLSRLQVCTYNRRNRYTCEGYGWLGGLQVPGSSVRYVHTWKPLGSMRDKLQARTSRRRRTKAQQEFRVTSCQQQSCCVAETKWR